jgi:hypothetical protein
MLFSENLKRGGILLESLPVWKQISPKFSNNIELNQVVDATNQCN